MREHADRHDLAFEALDHVLGAGALGEHHLERDLAPHLEVSREEHGAKAALTQQTADLIGGVDDVTDLRQTRHDSCTLRRALPRRGSVRSDQGSGGGVPFARPCGVGVIRLVAQKA